MDRRQPARKYKRALAISRRYRPRIRRSTRPAGRAGADPRLSSQPIHRPGPKPAAGSSRLAQPTPVDAVGFVLLSPDSFEKPVHHYVVLENQAAFADQPAPDHRFLDDVKDQHLGDAVPPILRHDPERNQTHGFYPALVIEQFCQSDRQPESHEATVDFLQRDIDVGHAEDESHRLVSDFREPDQFGFEEWFHLLRHVGEFLFAERDITPVFLPGLVINCADAARFTREIFQSALTKGYLLAAFSESTGELS